METDGAWGSEASPDLAAAAMELAEPHLQVFAGGVDDRLEAANKVGLPCNLQDDISADLV